VVFNRVKTSRSLTSDPASHYPRKIGALGERLNQRNLPDLVRQFPYLQDNTGDSEHTEETNTNSPGLRGMMHRETIRSTPRWTRGGIPGPRRNCVFEPAPGGETEAAVNDPNLAPDANLLLHFTSWEGVPTSTYTGSLTFGLELDPDPFMWAVVPYYRCGFRGSHH